MVDTWQRDDAKIAADAIGLWSRLGALPANLDPAARANELCAAAYQDDELVGVATMVAPEHRQQGLARKLGIYCRALLAKWSLDKPREEVLGMATIVESPFLDEVSKIVWPNAPGFNGLALSLIHI